MKNFYKELRKMWEKEDPENRNPIWIERFGVKKGNIKYVNWLEEKLFNEWNLLFVKDKKIKKINHEN